MAPVSMAANMNHNEFQKFKSNDRIILFRQMPSTQEIRMMSPIIVVAGKQKSVPFYFASYFNVLGVPDASVSLDHAIYKPTDAKIKVELWFSISNPPEEFHTALQLPGIPLFYM